MSCPLTSLFFFFHQLRLKEFSIQDCGQVSKFVNLPQLCLLILQHGDYSNISRMLHCITVKVVQAGFKRGGCHPSSNFLSTCGSLYFSCSGNFFFSEQKSRASPWGQAGQPFENSYLRGSQMQTFRRYHQIRLFIKPLVLYVC